MTKTGSSSFGGVLSVWMTAATRAYDSILRRVLSKVSKTLHRHRGFRNTTDTASYISDDIEQQVAWHQGEISSRRRRGSQTSRPTTGPPTICRQALRILPRTRTATLSYPSKSTRSYVVQGFLPPTNRDSRAPDLVGGWSSCFLQGEVRQLRCSHPHLALVCSSSTTAGPRRRQTRIRKRNSERDSVRGHW